MTTASTTASTTAADDDRQRDVAHGRRASTPSTDRTVGDRVRPRSPAIAGAYRSAHDPDERPITMSPGLPSTVLPPAEPAARAALAAALALDGDDRRAALAAVAARWPRYLDVWAALGDLGRDDIERYAYYRVGYHRGLDTLRANGWRGSGYVRWSEPTNQGFLRALAGLGAMAAAIGEDDEADRIALFLAQLDPEGRRGRA